MKHRLSAMALALSMGLPLTNGIFAADFDEYDKSEETRDFDLIESSASINTRAKTVAFSNEKAEVEVPSYEVRESPVFSKEMFPDDAFRTYLVNTYDPAGTQSTIVLDTIVGLSIDGNDVDHPEAKFIQNLNGIQSFKNLNTLSCGSLPKLTDINCSFLPQLTTISLDGSSVIQTLDCSNTNISSIDLSGKASLITLDCSNTKVSELDLGDKPHLDTLDCSSTMVSNLDLSGKPDLKYLNCSATNITSLDLNGKPALETLDCSGTYISSLDLSGTPALQTLNCSYTSVSDLGLSNTPSLKSLLCSHTNLSSLDVSNNAELIELNCSLNNILKLDLTGLSKLKNVNCSNNNNLTPLTLKGCSSLASLIFFGTSITTIDIRDCPNLSRNAINPNTGVTIIEKYDEPDYDYTVRGVADSYWQTDSTVQPKPVLKYGTYTLKEGKDYTITYKTDASGTKGTMTIKGKGIFAGVNKTVHYKIKPADTMKRLYNPNSGEHFYTSSDYEKSSLVRLGWRDESVGWTSPKTSNSPVYRLYNPNAGDHHYTKNASEKDMLVSRGWRYEGVAFYSNDDQKNGVPIYRQYNPNAKSGAHNYTSNRAEHDRLVRLGWRDEGIAWYGVDTTK